MLRFNRTRVVTPYTKVQMAFIGDSANGSSQPTVGYALVQLALYPIHSFLGNWNWKAALFSVLNRGTIFLILMVKRGTVEISVALIVEAAFSIAASGVYGAFTQAMCFTRPRWLARFIVGFFLPAVMLGLDYLAHYYTGMQHMRLSLILTGLLSVLSSLFSFYVMEHGALLVGSAGAPLARDLKRMPVLIAKFVVAGPRCMWHYVAGSARRKGLEIAA